MGEPTRHPPIRPVIIRGPTEIDQIVSYINQLYSVLTGNLTYDTNIRGRFFSCTFDAVPDTDLTVTHRFGYIPQGFLVVRLDTPATIYDGSAAWTATTVSLRSNGGSTVATVFLF